jgi:thiol-disulfide isomerase/thioredoxin
MVRSLRYCLAALLLLGAAGAATADPLDLSKYRGKVVYLDFWASWCTPCHLSFPWMNDIQQSYAGDGLAVIAVDLDRDRHAADEFLTANRGALTVVYDPKGEIARQFNFRDMPTAILIGRDGKVRHVHSGFVTSQENSYLADVTALLREKAQ